jgi:hypothetical protein
VLVDVIHGGPATIEIGATTVTVPLGATAKVATPINGVTTVQNVAGAGSVTVQVDGVSTTVEPGQSGTAKTDTTPPSIAGAPTTSPNAAGWYKGDVSIQWTCSDTGGAGLGAAACPANSVISGEGASLGVTAQVADLAGNSATGTVSGIHIDRSAPTIAFTGNNGLYLVDQTLSISCAATDTLSQLAGATCPGATGPAYDYSLGDHTLNATATDKADNPAAKSTTFTIGVTTASLCHLTTQFVEKGQKYLALNPSQRTAVAAIAAGLCRTLNAIVPGLTAKQKVAVIAAYQQGVKALASSGWLTTPQAATLGRLAASL